MPPWTTPRSQRSRARGPRACSEPSLEERNANLDAARAIDVGRRHLHVGQLDVPLMIADAELQLRDDPCASLREVPVAVEAKPQVLALTGAEPQLRAPLAAVELQAEDVVG